MNLYEGIKRVILVLSILVGALMFFAATEKGFTFDAFILSFLALGVIWGVYQAVYWVVKGFVDKGNRKPINQ